MFKMWRLHRWWMTQLFLLFNGTDWYRPWIKASCYECPTLESKMLQLINHAWGRWRTWCRGNFIEIHTPKRGAEWRHSEDHVRTDQLPVQVFANTTSNIIGLISSWEYPNTCIDYIFELVKYASIRNQQNELEFLKELEVYITFKIIVLMFVPFS